MIYDVQSQLFKSFLGSGGGVANAGGRYVMASAKLRFIKDAN